MTCRKMVTSFTDKEFVRQTLPIRRLKKITITFLNRQFWSLFIYLRPFHNHNSNTNLIKRRIFAWDMNQDHRDFRHRRTPTLITFDMANSGLYFINHRLVRR